MVIFTSVSLFTDHAITEYALAAELQRAGARVILIVCDRVMPICHAHDRYSCGAPSPNGSRYKQKWFAIVANGVAKQ